MSDREKQRGTESHLPGREKDLRKREQMPHIPGSDQTPNKSPAQTLVSSACLFKFPVRLAKSANFPLYLVEERSSREMVCFSDL